VTRALTLSAVAVLAFGCAEKLTAEERAGLSAGESCVPEAIPEGGFDPGESYLETSSLQCETRVCGVFGFDGDPTQSVEECEAVGGTDCADKPLSEAIEARVYCTCRCATPTDGAATCVCPTGFVCQELLGEEAGPGIAGSYCVREGLPAP